MQEAITDLVDLASDVARSVHHGQPYGNGSYFSDHLVPVVNEVAFYWPKSPAIQAMAYLHDVLEDTDLTVADLAREGFPPYVIEAVELLTDPGGTEWNRKQRKAALYRNFANATDLLVRDAAVVVKVADRLVNHTFSIDNNDVGKMSMYADEFPDFVQHILMRYPDGDILTEVNGRMFQQYRTMLKRVEAYR